MKNNKGFSLVELLAVVVIIGLITVLGIIAYTKYLDYAREKAYKLLYESSIHATEEYLMDHPFATSVELSELYEGQYLERPTDPKEKRDVCTGKVTITPVDGAGDNLNTYDYVINLCCEGYTHTYDTKTKMETTDKRCKVEPYDLDEIPTIKVLNVYPAAGAAYNLQNWMNSYGKGKIVVTPVSIENFNANPSSYLGTPGDWKYDEIVFGFWDCNASKDLSSASSSLVDTYLSEGGAAIFGHDTITKNGCGNHQYFNSLASHVNLTLNSGVAFQSSSSVQIVRKGVFTEYPYKIGDVGTNLTIPTSHVYGQVANGDIWITFNGMTDSNDANKIYLSTYGNNAMIQTGHSNGSATDDEQKIIANIIFYMVAKQYVNDD